MLTRLPSDVSGRAGQGLVHWRVWHSIVQERAAIEAELSETRGDPSPFPVVATEIRDPVDREPVIRFFDTSALVKRYSLYATIASKRSLNRS